MKVVSRHVCKWDLVAVHSGTLGRLFFSRCDECGEQRHSLTLMPSRCTMCKEAVALPRDIYCAVCAPIAKAAREAWERYNRYLHSPHSWPNPKGSRLYDAHELTSRAERELWRQPMILLPDRRPELVQEEMSL